MPPIVEVGAGDGELRTRTGWIRLEEVSHTPALVVTASGHVGPALVRFDLARAEQFGRRHAEGWWYVVDTTRVVLPSPLNLPHLRQIRRLPNLQGYVVVAPRAALRTVARVLGPLSRPDAVVRTVDEALALAASSGGHG